MIFFEFWFPSNPLRTPFGKMSARFYDTYYNTYISMRILTKDGFAVMKEYEVAEYLDDLVQSLAEEGVILDQTAHLDSIDFPTYTRENMNIYKIFLTKEGITIHEKAWPVVRNVTYYRWNDKDKNIWDMGIAIPIEDAADIIRSHYK